MNPKEKQVKEELEIQRDKKVSLATRSPAAHLVEATSQKSQIDQSQSVVQAHAPSQSLAPTVHQAEIHPSQSRLAAEVVLLKINK